MRKRCLVWFVSTVILILFLGCLGKVTVPVIAGARYVGTKACVEGGCHEDRYNEIKAGVHGEFFEEDQVDTPGCELCHGPGSKHLKSEGDPELILIYSEIKPKEASEVCLACHAKDSAGSWRSAHYENDVTCNTCHVSHSSGDETVLRKPVLKLCADCHSKVIEFFEKKYTHPLQGIMAEEGDKESRAPLNCVSCHKLHEKKDNSSGSVVNTSVCLECHVDRQGPFKFPHKVGEKSCLSCHANHGSNYASLCLDDIIPLCRGCHRRVFHRRGGLDRGSSTGGNETCLSCHKYIHGSKTPYLGDFLRRSGPRW